MRPILVLLAISLCLPVQARAQQAGGQTPEVVLEPPAPDQGYAFTLGLHLLGARVIDDGDALPGLLSGGSLVLRQSQSITRFMDLGVSLEFGVSKGKSERTGSLFLFSLDWTLRPVSPLSVRLGTGLGLHQVTAPTNSENDAAAFGAAFSLSVGYALYPFYDRGESGSWAFTPVLQFKTLEPFGEDAVFFGGLGIEVTYWAGLPDNQLDLSLEEAFSHTSSPDPSK